MSGRGKEQGRTKIPPQARGYLSGHTGPVLPGEQEGQGPPRSLSEIFPNPTSARLFLDTQSHTRSLPSSCRVSAGAASPAAPPSRGRRAPHPRTHLPPVAPAAGSASARTSAGPAPVRSLLAAPPSPRPREVEPAAAPESRSCRPELSRALTPRLLGGWAGRIWP